jgi:hypothetical protein
MCAYRSTTIAHRLTPRNPIIDHTQPLQALPGGESEENMDAVNEDTTPVLLAFSRHERWQVWCVYCHGWHVHRELGHQEPRCVSSDSEYLSTGYFLTDGGPLTYDRQRRFQNARPVRL